MKEAMIKAVDCLGFVVSDLREALGKAGAVEGIVLLDLIERAARLRTDAQALQLAQEMDVQVPDDDPAADGEAAGRAENARRARREK